MTQGHTLFYASFVLLRDYRDLILTGTCLKVLRIRSLLEHTDSPNSG